MRLQSIRIATVTTLTLLATATFAQAGPINCLGPAEPADRGFSVTITTGDGTATCIGGDAGHTDGTSTDLLGYTFIDKATESWPIAASWLTVIEPGASLGTFEISSAAWDIYNSMILVFKSAEDEQGVPDWAAFKLSPEVLAGSWTILPENSGNVLTQVHLYGANISRVSVAQIPEPSTLLLLGLGLVATARAARRRRSGTTV